MLLNEDLTGGNDVLGFGAKQPDGFNVTSDAMNAQIKHFLWRAMFLEKFTCGDVD